MRWGMGLAERVAARYQRRMAEEAPAIQDVVNELEKLKQLDQNLDEIETTFGLHFKLAALPETDPEVKSQFEALEKARGGLKAARSILKSVEEILKAYPDDKTAIRSKAEAEVMVKRFAKHEADAHKIIETISKKSMPETLKKMAGAAKKIIEAMFINPEHLRVIAWQSRMFKGVIYQMAFSIDSKAEPPLPENLRNLQLILEEDTTRQTGPNIFGAYQPTTAKEFAERFLDALKGWRGLKGESEAISGRKEAAEQVRRALDSALALGMDQDRATISHDNREVEGSYRSNVLPKEGERAVGEYEYGEMVERVLGDTKKSVERSLTHLKDKIEKIKYGTGEKSWVYVTVVLK